MIDMRKRFDCLTRKKNYCGKRELLSEDDKQSINAERRKMEYNLAPQMKQSRLAIRRERYMINRQNGEETWYTNMDTEAKDFLLKKKHLAYRNMNSQVKQSKLLAMKQAYADMDEKELMLKARRVEYAKINPEAKYILLESRRLEYADIDPEVNSRTLS